MAFSTEEPSHVRHRNATPRPVDKAEFWIQTIAAFLASGLSVRAFCVTRGLSEKRFYTWRRNLGLSPAPRSDARPAPAFVSVRVVPDAVAELVLPGLTLRLTLAAGPTPVVRLAAALRDVAC